MRAVDRGNGAAAIWCQPIYWDMAMNAYKLAKAQKDKKKTNNYKTLCEKIFAGNKAQYCQFDFDDNNENTGWFIYEPVSPTFSEPYHTRLKLASESFRYSSTPKSS